MDNFHEVSIGRQAKDKLRENWKSDEKSRTLQYEILLSRKYNLRVYRFQPFPPREKS